MASNIYRARVYRARELAAIKQTLRQPWPRTNGQDLGEAHVWIANGFEDAQVVAWLEAGVFRPITARFLQRERIEPRELGQEYSAGASLGYAFCVGLCSFKTVKRIVEGTL